MRGRYLVVDVVSAAEVVEGEVECFLRLLGEPRGLRRYRKPQKERAKPASPCTATKQKKQQIINEGTKKQREKKKKKDDINNRKNVDTTVGPIP